MRDEGLPPTVYRLLSHRMRGVKRQVAIVDFEGHDGHRRYIESSAFRGLASVEVPTSRLVSFGGLGAREEIAHLIVPGLPRPAAKLVHDLRAVVVVVHVGVAAEHRGAFTRENLHALLQGWLVPWPAGVHSAEQADGRRGQLARLFGPG